MMHMYSHTIQLSNLLYSSYLLMAAAPPTTFPAPAPALTSTPRTWTYCDLIKDVLTSEEDILYWLQRKNLLASSMDCPKCASSCRIVKRKSSFSWRCPRKVCRAVVSAREKSFFSKSKLSFATMLKLMYLWSRQTRVTEAAAEVKVSNRVALIGITSFVMFALNTFLYTPSQLEALARL